MNQRQSAVCLIAAACLSFAAPSRAITTMNAAPVHKTVLKNGLTVLVREDHTAPVVSAQFWVHAGSVTEGPWLGAGLSHVLEHMLFKGTTTRGVSQIAQEIEDKGGYINAYTSFEQTVFHIDIPSANWQTAVDILADCMMNATIPEEELVKEQKVILREMAMNEDDPDRRAGRLLWSTAYAVHPYRHPVIGYPDIYNRVTRQDVVNYYKKFYVPNNIVFVVVGDINADQVLAHLTELTKGFAMGAIEPPYVPAEPPQLSARQRDEEMPIQLAYVDLAWHVPNISSPDVYPLDVLAIILGQGRSSRLYQDLREKRGLVHSIAANNYTPRYPGLFTVEAQTDADKREAAITAIREEIQRVRQQPVSPAEVQKAIKITVSQMLDRLKTMDGQASDIANNQFLLDDPNFSQTYLANIQRVTADDVQRVARTYLTDQNQTTTTLDPTGSLATTKTKVVESAGIQIKEFKLANGLRLLVREDPKLPAVDIRALLKGGVIAETKDTSGLTKLTTRMLLKGTKRRTAEQIAESIESVGGSISYFSGNNSFGITAHALSDDLDRALDLVADVLQNPMFPDDMLNREREVQLAEIKDEDDQIMRSAQQVLREELFAKSPYRLNPLGTPETLAKFTRQNLIDFQKRYVVPGNIVLCVFGNVKADDIRQRVEARFGRMPATKLNFPTVAPERLAATVRREETKPKQQAVLLIGYSGTDIFSPDRYALELIDNAFSGQGSRLFLRLRDELGLCYYVGAYELLGLQPGYFTLYIGTMPDKVALCEKELSAEVAKLVADGLTPEDLDRAKNSLIGQLKVRMQDNSELTMIVGLDELYGLGYDNFQKQEPRYRSVTVDDIKRVAQTYFGGKPYAVAIVKPK